MFDHSICPLHGSYILALFIPPTLYLLLVSSVIIFPLNLPLKTAFYRATVFLTSLYVLLVFMRANQVANENGPL